MGFRVAQMDAVFTADTRQIDAATRKVEGDLKGVGTTAQQTSGKMGGAFQKVGGFARGMGGAMASAGIGLFLKKTADDASALGEVVDFTASVFGKNAKAMEAWGETTLDSIGAAKVTALDAANGFGVLMNAADLTGKQSVEMSQAMVKLAGDMSSAKDVPLEESLMAIRSGLVGESEPLRRFGILLNEAAVSEEALRLGLVKEGEALTDAAKTRARVSLITKEGAVYNDNYADTADSMANQQRRASEAAKEASAELGKNLAPIMAKAYGHASDLAGAFSKLPDPVKTGTLALLGVGAALPILVRVYDVVVKLRGGIMKLARSKAVTDAIVGAAAGLGETARLAGGGIRGLTLATAAYGGVLAAGVVAIYAWSKALDEAKKAAAAVEESTKASEGVVGAWGKQLEAGIITQTQFNQKVEALMPAAHKAQDGLGGLIDEGFSFVRGEKTAAEVTEERQRIMARAKEVTDAYTAAQKRQTSVSVAGAKATRTATVKSLKAQWTFMDMNLEKYREWAAGTKGALNGVQGKLGDLAGKAKLTARRISSAFDRQLDQQKNYAKDFGAILDRGIAKKAPELTRQLQEMGLEGAGIVKALAGANKDEFQTIIRQWKEAESISDRTSRAVVRHTRTWGDDTAKAMDPALESLTGINREMEDLAGWAAQLDGISIKVSGSGVSGDGLGILGTAKGGTPTAIAQGAVAKFGGVLTSGYRPGSTTASGNTSLHSIPPPNNAVDFGGSAAQMRAGASWIAGTYGSQLRELIHTPLGFGIKDGKKVPLSFFGDVVNRMHTNHVHVADEGVVAMKRSLVKMGGPKAGGPEAAIPLRSRRGRAELARAMASAQGGRGRLTGTVRIVGFETAVVDLVEEGVDGYDRHLRRRDRAGA